MSAISRSCRIPPRSTPRCCGFSAAGEAEGPCTVVRLAPPRLGVGERGPDLFGGRRAFARRVREPSHTLGLAATPPHPDSFATLGIRPLPASGERACPRLDRG